MTKEIFFSGLKVVVERMNPTEIYLTIWKFKKKHWFWGDIWQEADQTICVRFTEGENRNFGCYLTVYNNHTQHIPVEIANINKFNLYNYCKDMVNSYKERKEKSMSLKDKVTTKL